MRLDLLLKQKLALSRQQAQDLIVSGAVLINNKVVKKPAMDVDKDVDFVIQDKHLLKYVSRAGLKLEGALQYLGLQVKGLNVVDLGQSTGGFSDCLLQAGAAAVFGLDVGHGQLHDKIKYDKRLRFLEGCNLKDFTQEDLYKYFPKSDVGLFVADLSFISSLSLLTHITSLMPVGASLLLLVKPQFELGAKNLNKKGIVKSQDLYAQLAEDCKKSSQQAGLRVLDYFSSELEGKDGNKEFFLYAKKDRTST